MPAVWNSGGRQAKSNSTLAKRTGDRHMKPRIITIGCDFGAGGPQIGKALAEALGIEYYDRDLVDKVVSEIDVDRKVVEEADTHTHASYEYQTKYGPRYANLTNRVISVQNEVIHRMAAQGPCVIIGRSANFLLEDRDDVLNLFIYAPKSIRVASIMEQFDAGQERAEEMVRYNDEINHARHKYITGTYRGDRNGRHMLLDSSLLGWDGTVRYLLALIEMLVEE